MKRTFTNVLIAACMLAGGLLFYQQAEFVNLPAGSNVVIIDKSLEDYQELARSSRQNTRVILVENTDTGFADLEKEIGTLHDVARLHILTHGTNGNFVLGRQQLNEDNINRFSRFWKAVSQSFASEKSELLIYSCQLAGSRGGKSFVDRLHALLGVSVASSDDNTGSSESGGNWDLEYIAGRLIKDHVLKYLDYKGLLIPYFSALEGSNSPFDAMKIYTDDQLIYGDFDADGDIDIHLYPASGGTENQFWRNNGSGSFSQVSGAGSPFNNITEKSAFYGAKYAFVADWDNDGDTDIFVTKRAASDQNIFYKNNNGVYQEITGSASPFDAIKISGDDQLIYGDFDADGDIDIHSYPGSGDNEFWQNNGTGQFTKVTGSANPFRDLANTAAFYTSAAFARVADWDNDGDVDIFVTRRSIGAATGENIFYRNDNGIYVELAGSASPFKNIAIVQDNQYIYGDFDADGDIDIQASSSNASTTLKFWRNNGSGTFTDATGTANPFNNIPNNGAFYNNAAKAFVADWDNDKDVDIFVTARTASDQNILFVQSDAPPAISSTTPANLATGVSVKANIMLNFNRPVNAVADKNIVIRRVSDNSIFATIPTTDPQVSGNSTTSITINPTSDLGGNTTYYVLVDKGAFADLDGRIFSGISTAMSLRFTTGAAATAPALTTSQVSIYNTNTATMGGAVIDDGGEPVTEYGIVWSTSPSPTLANNKTVIGTGTGTFSQSISALPTGMQIFVRAYAINAVGTSYGNEVSFYTKTSVAAISRVSPSPTNSAAVTYTVTFAQSTSGVEASDFTLAVSGLTGAFISEVSGSGTTYTVTIGTGTGNGTIRLDFTGTAGTVPNVSSAFNNAEAYEVYKVSTAASYFRTRNSTANWNAAESWESSADNSFWIPATIFPNASTAIVTVAAGQTIELPEGFAPATGNLVNNGTIDVKGTVLTVASTLTNAGTLKGSGSFVVSDFTNAGVIAPGNSPGMLSFSGKLTNNGVINIELGGTTAGSEYDQIQVLGTMLFSGTLNVSLADNYIPKLGDTFTIIDAANSTGEFATINLPVIPQKIWETTYDNANGTLVVKLINDPLPVTLVNFDAARRESEATLQWATSQETNSSHFEIQRSAKGQVWQPIGSVVANTESSTLRNYEFTDHTPMPGENLYRLKMVDLDGSFAYSRIRNVNFGVQPIEISTYPNPATERIFFNLADTRTVSGIAIYNLSGMLVSRFDTYTTDGIPVQNLSAGSYLVKLDTSDGRSRQLKFVKN
ncbi:DUF4347 domain-containing protein [Dyadobacter sp. CY261]|uniref:DUF4347 domain-containing protein n=1 Tax=Dyadobacter sp. CY261 TaxID=2907203 RepID=UPI001F163A91|nr:DUF4347 domain-containing protein [Dyadobacter sp. CY261]MCF0074906.1 DUF4347 domain-containing protein [Dyadobacter sp. CY261]